MNKHAVWAALFAAALGAAADARVTRIVIDERVADARGRRAIGRRL